MEGGLELWIEKAQFLTLVTLLAILWGGSPVPLAGRGEDHPLIEAVIEGLESGSETFDHSTLDNLLQRHVSAAGEVDYLSLMGERKQLKAYLESVAAADLSTLAGEEILAFLINAYNACTLDLICSEWPVKSIKEIVNPWKEDRHLIAGVRVSLDFIEHSLLRKEELFDEPRIHFAINCASKGCPPLRNRAFLGKGIGKELAESVERTLRSPKHLRVKGDRVEISKIFSWFASDFSRGESTVLRFLSQHAPSEAVEILEERGEEAIYHRDFDWSINLWKRDHEKAGKSG